MLPIQEITIGTKNQRLFFVHLEHWDDQFECKLAAIDLGPQGAAYATFGPYANGPTGRDVFRALLESLRAEIRAIDPTNSIAAIDNPCDAEFVSAEDQRTIAGRSVTITMNGAVP